MSEQNLALVRQIYDAWDRDGSAREFIAEDVEYVNPSYAVEPGTRVGRKSFAVVRDTLEGEHGYVWTLRDGQAVRFCWFSSHAEALEAAGLSKPA